MYVLNGIDSYISDMKHRTYELNHCPTLLQISTSVCPFLSSTTVKFTILFLHRRILEIETKSFKSCGFGLNPSHDSGEMNSEQHSDTKNWYNHKATGLNKQPDLMSVLQLRWVRTSGFTNVSNLHCTRSPDILQTFRFSLILSLSLTFDIFTIQLSLSFLLYPICTYTPSCQINLMPT